MKHDKTKLSDNVVLVEDFALILTNANRKQFTVLLEEVDSFLVTLYKLNETIEHLIVEHEQYKNMGSPWIYQEKPYREIVTTITLEKYPIIYPMIGSQTKGLFNAIGLYVYFVLKKEKTNVLPFDKYSLQEFFKKKKSVQFSFHGVCEFCVEYDSRETPYSTSDPNVYIVKEHLSILSAEIKERFQDEKVNIKYSQGSGKFPRVPYLCILPENQTVSDGVYVAVCFGKEGNGAVVGTAESVTNRKGLKTISRNRSENFIDVDGSSSETKYNDAFVNPIDFYDEDFSEEEFFTHLDLSLKMCLDHLNLTNSKQRDFSAT